MLNNPFQIGYIIPDYNKGYSITSPFTAPEAGMINIQGGNPGAFANITVNGVRVIHDEMYVYSCVRTNQVVVNAGDVVTFEGQTSYEPKYTFFPCRGA